MIRLKRILVARDFSGTSEAAMRYAVAAARLSGASLDVLHVSHKSWTDIASEFTPGAEPIHEDGARERMLEIITPREGMKELHPTLQLRPGRPHQEIALYARARDIDLIVMGTHGRGLVAHAVMGSVAERVVRTAPCPVLTVRGAYRELAAPNILVATDFGAASDIALEYARALGSTFGAKLHVLHVTENYFMRPVVIDPYELESRAREQLSEQLTDGDRQTLHATAALVTSDTPAEAIVQYANTTSIDLIIIGTHGRQSTERLLMGSVAERVVRTASCPVLTVRHPERVDCAEDRCRLEGSRASRNPTGRCGTGVDAGRNRIEGFSLDPDTDVGRLRPEANGSGHGGGRSGAWP